MSSDPNQNRIVSIYGAARLGEQAVRLGMATVLILFAMINIFIGIFNLLPLLPLDGGFKQPCQAGVLGQRLAQSQAVLDLPCRGARQQFDGVRDQHGSALFMVAVERQDRLPHARRGIDALLMQQPLEEVNGDVEMLVGKCQDR